MANHRTKHVKQRLKPNDVLYCQKVSAGADERKTFNEVYKDVLPKTKCAVNIKFSRHKARAEIKEKIAKIQAENEKILKKRGKL